MNIVIEVTVRSMRYKERWWNRERAVRSMRKRGMKEQLTHSEIDEMKGNKGRKNSW